jgi:hypothetical protein
MSIEAPAAERTEEGSGVRSSAEPFPRAPAPSDPRASATPQPARLGSGQILSERFVIEGMTGSGGMGAVYRALDRATGGAVAIKVMARCGKDDGRFIQEARVLSELTHPAIVQYVAHGTTSEGEPYLAMEWLDGEDLAHRLARTRLTVAESLTLTRRIAEGLAVSHARGVLHRDVKPSNVFLVEGNPSRAKLLDFGIVRLQLSARGPHAHPRTGTGRVLGTVGYMSPEQAVADRAVDARTDIFALGCLLFECLTGEPAFSGAHDVAVLVKVLREEAPRVRHLRTELPAALDELVARMLRKDKAERPSDVGVVLRELEALGSVADGAAEETVRPPQGLSGGEQRWMGLMLAVLPDEPQRVNEIVRRRGGEHTRLANGALLVTLTGQGSTGEQLFAAAACSLELLEAFPTAHIALATGRAQTADGAAPGQLIDRAAALLSRSARAGVRTDEVTAGLLGNRFEFRPEGEGQLLLLGRVDVEPPRTLLGKPTPCVGRDKELTLLEGTLRECIEESVARAVLVTGPAGQGKSRLRHEFMAKVRARADVTILTARGDPVGAGCAFLLARQLIRQASGLRDGEPAAEQHAKLAAHVASVCAGNDVVRIADFLGQLVGVPPSDRPGPQLRASRDDPQMMAVWLARSFGEWLAAECVARPVLVALEDLHWGDLPSVTYLGEALRALVAKPLMVLATARPEVHEVFPKVWWPGKHEVPLDRLGPRAAERLVRVALGDTVEADVVARVVERADGNAFYLEELIRRVAEGGSDTLPETVLALVQSRLARLEADARRVVRAASVFGAVFWQGGVAQLLGEGSSRGDLDAWLKSLVEREVFAVAPQTRFAGEREYGFRHALLRDAAYAMLTEADAIKGHKLAAQWLEAAGEKDALKLADHLERGGEPTRAVPWLVRAAARAIDMCDVAGERALAERGLACGAEGADAGLLHFARALALFGRGDVVGAIAPAQSAMDLLPAATTRWFAAAGFLFMSGVVLGDPSVSAPILLQILQAPLPENPSGPFGFAVNLTCTGLATSAQMSLARSFLQRAETVGTGLDPDPMFGLWVPITRSVLQVCAGQPGLALNAVSGVVERVQETGDEIIRVTMTQWLTAAYAALGDCARAERSAEDIRQLSELRFNHDFGALLVAVARLHVGRGAEAIPCLRELTGRRDPLIGDCSRAHLAVALEQVGDLDASEREALMALEQGAMLPHAQLPAFAALGSLELRRGHATGALAWADRGLASEAHLWHVPTLCLLRAEALHALGRAEEARVALRAARDRITTIAATVEDPELRDSWMTNVTANARALRLAGEWL